jgi:hypothetical protein
MAICKWWPFVEIEIWFGLWFYNDAAPAALKKSSSE